MKKLLQATTLVACAVAALQADTTGRSFFSARSHFQSVSPERLSTFRNEFCEMNINGYGGAMQLVPYGSRSTNPERLARYFLPPTCNGDCFLRVQESNRASLPSMHTDDANYLKDLEASNFNVRTVNRNFESNIYFEPRQTVIGLGITYRQELTYKNDGRTKLWFEASMPIEQVNNSMNLTEKVIHDGGGAIKDHLGLDGVHFANNMVEAFRQSNWHYGKIDSCQCPSKKTGIADIELKLGANYISCGTGMCDKFNWSNFIGMVIPTGNRPEGKYVFEPIVGNNHHWGVMAGNSMYVKMWEKDCQLLSLNLDVASKYLFGNHQTRSFDLAGKPWSRYLETYSSEVDAWIAQADENGYSGTSGINEFTKCVNVHPHFVFNLNWGLLYSYKLESGSWLIEAGYNFYARQAEQVELDCCAVTDVAIKSAVPTAYLTTLAGSTSRARTIGENYPLSSYSVVPSGYTTYQRIHACEFDMDTAAHPAVLSYTLYGSFGYQWDGKNHPTFVTVGGSYEFSSEHTNNNIDRYTFWGKLGFSF